MTDILYDIKMLRLRPTAPSATQWTGNDDRSAFFLALHVS